MRIGEWITGAVRDKNARFKIASAAPLPGAKPEAKSTPMQMAKKKGDEEMTELEQTEKRLSSQIEGLIGSLQTEMHELMGSLETEMHEGFDRIDANTKRTMGLVAADAVALGAFKKWATSQDVREKRRDAEIRELRLRVRKLERSVSGRKA